MGSVALCRRASHGCFSGAEFEGVVLRVRKLWHSSAAQVKQQRAEMQATEFEQWNL